MPKFCPKCDISNSSSRETCKECGAILDPSAHGVGEEKREVPPLSPEPPKLPPKRSRRSGRSGRDGSARPTGSVRVRRHDRQKVQATRELDSAAGFVRGLQGIFWIGALLFGFVTGAGFLLLGKGGLSQSGSTLLLLVTLGLTIFLVFGALNLKKDPFTWSLGLAVPTTLLVGATVLARRGLPPIPAAVMLLTWVGVFMGLRIRGILRQHPDLSLEDGDNAGSLPQMLLKGTGAIAIFLLLGVGGQVLVSSQKEAQANTHSTALKPLPPVKPLLGDFEKAWNAKDLKALSALYAEHLASRGRRLGRRMKSHGYEDFPKLKSGPQIETKGFYGRSVVYDTEAGEIELVYKFSDGKWELIAFRM